MGGVLAQQLAARVQPLALVLLAPAAPYGINSLSLTNAGLFLHYISNGAFWRNGYKPDFARAQRYAFCGIPADRHRLLYDGLVYESGRAIFEIALWLFDLTRAAAVEAQRISCPVYIVSGGEDRVVPPSVLRKIARLYPQATHRHYPACGHLLIDDENTNEMVHSISDWLQAIQRKHEG
jgi:pimeloyl-ACP methyl ester carboxylesterase